MADYVQLSNAGDGTILGQSASDPVGFYGKTPIAQGAAVTVATAGMTAPDLVPIINGLRARLEAVGLIATA